MNINQLCALTSDEMVSNESIAYPRAEYKAQCPQHGKWVNFKISHFERMNEYDPSALIRRVAKMAIAARCPDCIREANEVKLPPTRWPNAGEPGGAEL